MTSEIEHLSVIEHPSTMSSRPRRTHWLRLSLAVTAVALLATGCGNGPGSQEDLVGVLMGSGSLSEAEADCIASDIFEEYEEDGDALSAISAAPDFAYLEGEEGVPGFSEFFNQTVQRCAAVGPTAG